MGRYRLAVALVVPEPRRAEIDGLRRAVGFDLARIAPHITLVPPINVREESIPEVLGLLRSAAGGHGGPLSLTLGPPGSFAPKNRVLYLSVRGEQADQAALLSLRRVLGSGPLEREEARTFVPHVTLTNRLPGDLAPDVAVGLLGGFQVDVTFERVDLLAYDGDLRRWSTLADAFLGPRRVVGRGGLALELTPSTTLDPEAAATCRLVAGAGSGAGSGPPPVEPPPGDAVHAGERRVVVARRDGAVVGVAAGRAAGEAAWLDGVGVLAGSRREGIGAHLLASLVHELATLGARWVLTAGSVDAATRELLVARGWRPSGPGAGALSVTLG